MASKKPGKTRSSTRSAPRPYHHGSLPDALLRATAELVAEQGPAQLSLREVARRAGVSHGAPAHHFGDKAGLLTALATDGFVRFHDAMSTAAERAGSDVMARFCATGVAYVLFAQQHRAHFEIMFRTDIGLRSEPALQAAAGKAYAVLYDGILAAQAAGHMPGQDPLVIATTSWSLVHGLATLWLQGNLRAVRPDLESLARLVIQGHIANQ